jgi:SET domain-containing protein
MWPEDKQEKLLFYAYQCNETELVNEQGPERFMNHSCDPNCWWADDDTIVARRDILPGEEITYDYAMTEVNIEWQMICRCGATNCRGLITNKDHRDPKWQALYGDNLPSHTRKAIAHLRR